MNNDNTTTEDRYTFEEAEQLAIQLMQQHGVTSQGWSFAWGRGINTQGYVMFKAIRCQWTGRTETLTQKLCLSRNLVKLNNRAAVRDVILHEIAHILAGLSNGHNHVWKAKCREIGAIPEQYCSSARVATVPHRFHVVCGCCDRVLQKRHKRPKAGAFDRKMCSKCMTNSLGKIKIMDVSPLTTPI